MSVFRYQEPGARRPGPGPGPQNFMFRALPICVLWLVHVFCVLCFVNVFCAFVFVVCAFMFVSAFLCEASTRGFSFCHIALAIKDMLNVDLSPIPPLLNRKASEESMWRMQNFQQRIIVDTVCCHIRSPRW